MNEIISSIVVGVITGAFSAVTIIITLKVEMKFLRRDVDSLMMYVYKRSSEHV